MSTTSWCCPASTPFLDKACLLGRCGTTTAASEAIRAVAAMKRDFTVEDVYARGARVLERAIVHGTTRMRTHVEIDPRIGLRGFEAIKALKRDYAWAIDLSICVFPQEGLTNDPGTEQLLVAALRDGGDLIGGCPYMDTDPMAQLEKLFDLAQAFDVDVDLHLDFDLDPSWWHLDEVLRQTERRNYQGRVAIGHAPNYPRCRQGNSMPPRHGWRAPASPSRCCPPPIFI
jgi:cytosine deaminase